MRKGTKPCSAGMLQVAHILNTEVASSWEQQCLVITQQCRVASMQCCICLEACGNVSRQTRPAPVGGQHWGRCKVGCGAQTLFLDLMWPVHAAAQQPGTAVASCSTLCDHRLLIHNCTSSMPQLRLPCCLLLHVAAAGLNTDGKVQQTSVNGCCE